MTRQAVPFERMVDADENMAERWPLLSSEDKWQLIYMAAGIEVNEFIKRHMEEWYDIKYRGILGMDDGDMAKWVLTDDTSGCRADLINAAMATVRRRPAAYGAVRRCTAPGRTSNLWSRTAMRRCVLTIWLAQCVKPAISSVRTAGWH